VEIMAVRTVIPRAVPLWPMEAGNPMVMIFLMNVQSGFRSLRLILRPTFPENMRYIPMSPDSPLVITVVRAAPEAPMAGSPHQPNTKNGSKMVSRTAEETERIMGVLVSPYPLRRAWNPKLRNMKGMPRNVILR
jgi:hypothetical protein